MKKYKSIIAAALYSISILIPQFAISQSPEKMSYQTIVRGASGDLITESPVGIQISILQGSAIGTVEYIETQSATTNVNGLASVEIGMGSIVLGTFGDIDWSNGPYYVKTEVDPNGGISYSMSATTELLSVPYALHSKTSDDNQWFENGSGINTWNSRVGINSGNPLHTLDVRSLSQADAAGLNISNDDRSRYVRFFSGSDMFPDPSMSWVPGQSLLFATFDDITFDYQEKMRISSLGDVGIGIDNPEAKLDIKGGDWNLDAGNPGDLRIGNSTHNFRIGIATGGGGAGITRMYTNSNALIFGVNDTPSLRLNPNGEITAPSLTNTLIDDGGDKSLVTKEYIAALEAQIETLAPQPASIGDIKNGGVVFWVNSTGLHGLVCAFEDYPSTREYGCYLTDLSNVPNVITLTPTGSGAEIGDGYTNTNDILNDCPTAPAALAARSYGPEWYLPSSKELNELYKHKSTLEAIPGFSAFNTVYWSSTEYNDILAWVQTLAAGGRFGLYKDELYNVRAVRAF